MAMRFFQALGVAAALLAVPATGLLAVPAAAVTTQVFAQGTWGQGAPVTSHSAPGQNFSVSFTLYTPLPPDAVPGGPYDVLDPPLSFFIMNGVPDLEPPLRVSFRDTAAGGLFDIVYAAETISLFGTDVGSTGALGYGLFAVDFGIDGQAGLGSGQLGITAVPEPAGWALMITGFGLAGTLLRHRRAAAAA